jgi:hypothetical protein
MELALPRISRKPEALVSSSRKNAGARLHFISHGFVTIEMEEGDRSAASRRTQSTESNAASF